MAIGAEAKSAFVAGLAKGLKLGAAAGAAGHALASFYRHRALDPDFAEAWDKAAAASAWAHRRHRLTPARAGAFLERLASECNTTAAAFAAGVHRATVYRRIARDPDFARANAAALERGYASLEIEAAAERESAAERWRSWAPADVGAGPTKDFDKLMNLLTHYWRPARKRWWRRRRAPSHSETIEWLRVRLKWMERG